MRQDEAVHTNQKTYMWGSHHKHPSDGQNLQATILSHDVRFHHKYVNGAHCANSGGASTPKPRRRTKRYKEATVEQPAAVVILQSTLLADVIYPLLKIQLHTQDKYKYKHQRMTVEH